jgi:hypothetical protein
MEEEDLSLGHWRKEPVASSPCATIRKKGPILRKTERVQLRPTTGGAFLLKKYASAYRTVPDHRSHPAEDDTQAVF